MERYRNLGKCVNGLAKAVQLASIGVVFHSAKSGLFSCYFQGEDCYSFLLICGFFWIRKKTKAAYRKFTDSVV